MITVKTRKRLLTTGPLGFSSNHKNGLRVLLTQSNTMQCVTHSSQNLAVMPVPDTGTSDSLLVPPASIILYEFFRSQDPETLDTDGSCLSS
jgi:hypothetical protein